MEILIILLLILLNGYLAMAEIAMVSARKSKLQQKAQDGNENAQIALEITQSPGRFLSTVQVGITLVGIFAGAFGGATIATPLAETIKQVPIIAPFSTPVAFILVVTIITYLSIIFGELVPKRLALSDPETIASFVAPPMHRLSLVAGPLVSLLNNSTDGLLNLLKIAPAATHIVSDEEVRILLREGAQTGSFEPAEKDIVEKTLKLSDRKVNMLMTPRNEIVWLDLDSSLDQIRSVITAHPHSYFPVCKGNPDKVVGVVRTKNLLTEYLTEKKVHLKKLIHKPLFIPESMDSLKVLELFKKSGIHVALIADEYGNTLGLLSLTDVLEAIVGDIPTLNELEEKEIVERKDGSFLVDGLLPIDELKEFFEIKKIPGEKSGVFNTVGGMITEKLERIPTEGDIYTLEEFRFEVVDMDGNRVDKILVTKKKLLTIKKN